MKVPMTLFYRDGVEVAQHLFSNPIFKHCLELRPYRLYEELPDGGQGGRVYGEFMSGDFAWEYQVSNPIYRFMTPLRTLQTTLEVGSCLLGIILASDKTSLTVGTGGRKCIRCFSPSRTLTQASG